jgi:hypothetical protein
LEKGKTTTASHGNPKLASNPKIKDLNVISEGLGNFLNSR